MSERRRETRSPTYLGGKITYAKKTLSTECVVRERSAHGALVFVRGSGVVPDAFDLAIPSKGEVMRVETRWRRRDAAGVEIVDASTPAPESEHKPGFPEERIRRLKAENDLLKRRLRDLTE